MSISLVKGQGINLSKDSPDLKRVRFGLGWSPNASGGADFDLDASAFMLRADPSGTPKLISDEYLVFYNNKTSPDDATHHSGDDLTGGGGGGKADDESIIVDLSKVNPLVTEISLVVTIYKWDERNQTFGQVKNSYIKLYNDETGKEIAKYSLQDDMPNATVVRFGTLTHDDKNHWTFTASGDAYDKKGLADLITIYGGKAA